MEEKFVQKSINLSEVRSTGKMKVETLCELLDGHPYKATFFKVFDIEKIKNEVITIDHIDTLYNRVKYFDKNFSSLFQKTFDFKIARIFNSIFN